MSGEHNLDWVRLRYLADFNPAVPTAVRANAATKYQLLPMDSINEFTPPSAGEERLVGELLSGYSYMEPTDVAYAKVTPCFENGKGLIGSELNRPTFGTTELTVLRPRTGVDQSFLSYVLQSDVFREPAIASMTGAGGLRRVSESAMRDLKLPAPSEEEQRRIADYLDRETAEIDAFTSGLKDLVRLSSERWRAVRDQGIFGSWEGVSERGRGRSADCYTWAPEFDRVHSEGPFKRCFDVTLGKMLDERQQDRSQQSYSYLRAGNIGDGSISFDDLKEMPFSSSERVKYSLRAGDLLVVEGGAVGNNSVLPSDVGGVYFQKTVNRARPRKGVDPRYFAEVLNSYRDRGVFDVVGNKSTIAHLTAEKLNSMYVPIPSYADQREIASRLSTLRTHTLVLEKYVEKALELSQERRAALITAAVTGQIDVTAKHKPVAEQLEDELAEVR